MYPHQGFLYLCVHWIVIINYLYTKICVGDSTYMWLLRDNSMRSCRHWSRLAVNGADCWCEHHWLCCVMTQMSINNTHCIVYWFLAFQGYTGFNCWNQAVCYEAQIWGRIYCNISCEIPTKPDNGYRFIANRLNVSHNHSIESLYISIVFNLYT